MPLAPVLTHKDAIGWIRVSENFYSRQLVNRAKHARSSYRNRVRTYSLRCKSFATRATSGGRFIETHSSGRLTPDVTRA